MIDIENDVFDTVAKELKAKFPGIWLSGEYTETPASFPAVTIREADNYVGQRYITAERSENAASVMYEVQIFSSKANGKKAEAKQIAQAVDNIMSRTDYGTGFGFTRTFSNPVPNSDQRIYRYVLRYTGIVGPDGNGKFLVYNT